MYPDSGYKQAHAQSVCTRPFSRVVGRGLGTKLHVRTSGQGEIIFEAGQLDRWAWLMLDTRPDFRCSQGVKHENLVGQDLDRGRGWKYRRLCSVPPPPPPPLELLSHSCMLLIRPSLVIL